MTVPDDELLTERAMLAKISSPRRKQGNKLENMRKYAEMGGEWAKICHHKKSEIVVTPKEDFLGLFEDFSRHLPDFLSDSARGC